MKATVKKVSIASKWDNLLTKGGDWKTLVKKCTQVSTKLGGTQKVTIGTLKAHVNFRINKQNKANYLGSLKVNGIGIVRKEAEIMAELIK